MSRVLLIPASRRLLGLAAALAVVVLALSGGGRVPVASALGTVFTVTQMTPDSNSAAAQAACIANTTGCTLRAAITVANSPAYPDPDTINVPAGTYILQIPGVNEDANDTGDLDITDDLTINGAGANMTTIDGNHIDRVFDIRPVITTNVLITGLTVTGGKTLTSSPGGGSGGGILAQGTLVTLTNVAVDHNEAANGGGIFVGGPVTLNNSTISNNTAITGGFGGGGILNYINGPLTLNNSTVSGNTGHFAGGIVITSHAPPLILNNSTISDNGGGLYNGGGAITIKNTILADNGASGNCTFSGGTLTSRGHNLSTDQWCEPAHLISGGLDQGSDLNETPAGLGPLFLNPPGSTATQALLPGSLAIDAGDNATCLATDQRGVPRPQDGDGNGSAICDIGAYEVGTTAAFTSTGEYCLTGDSTGTPWTWEIKFPTNSGTTTYSGSVSGVVPIGSHSNVIAAAWVYGMNNPKNPGLLAVQSAPPRDNCFELFLGSTSLATGTFTFKVNSCTITGNPLGCAFNPTVVEVPPVGGTTELVVGEGGSPFPSLPLAAGAAAALAVLSAGLWYGRRWWLR